MQEIYDGDLGDIPPTEVSSAIRHDLLQCLLGDFPPRIGVISKGRYDDIFFSNLGTMGTSPINMEE